MTLDPGGHVRPHDPTVWAAVDRAVASRTLELIRERDDLAGDRDMWREIALGCLVLLVIATAAIVRLSYLAGGAA